MDSDGPSDKELGEWESQARRTDLWDDQDRDELENRIARARKQRGQSPSPPP